MTDTTLDPIDVWRQHRGSDGLFPGGPGGGGGNPDAPVLLEDPLEPPLDPPPTVHPCQIPEAALEWNAAAAAAAAAKEIARLVSEAGENGLNYRERGAFLFQRPDGSVGFGRIHESEPFDENGDAALQLTYDGIDPLTIIGSIHSHQDGNHRPSGPSPRPGMGEGDTGHFAFLQGIMPNPSQARIYILARNQVGANQTPYNQINFYNQANMQASQDQFRDGQRLIRRQNRAPDSVVSSDFDVESVGTARPDTT